MYSVYDLLSINTDILNGLEYHAIKNNGVKYTCSGNYHEDYLPWLYAPSTGLHWGSAGRVVSLIIKDTTIGIAITQVDTAEPLYFFTSPLQVGD